jgi:hypothetical protein
VVYATQSMPRLPRDGQNSRKGELAPPHEDIKGL